MTMVSGVKVSSGSVKCSIMRMQWPGKAAVSIRWRRFARAARTWSWGWKKITRVTPGGALPSQHHAAYRRSASLPKPRPHTLTCSSVPDRHGHWRVNENCRLSLRNRCARRSLSVALEARPAADSPPVKELGGDPRTAAAPRRAAAARPGHSPVMHRGSGVTVAPVPTFDRACVHRDHPSGRTIR